MRLYVYLSKKKVTAVFASCRAGDYTQILSFSYYCCRIDRKSSSFARCVLKRNRMVPLSLPPSVISSRMKCKLYWLMRPTKRRMRLVAKFRVQLSHLRNSKYNVRATFCCLLRHNWCHCRTRLVRTFSCIVSARSQTQHVNRFLSSKAEFLAYFPAGAIGSLKTESYFANLRKITLDTECASNRYPKGIHLHIQWVVVGTYWILIVYLWCTY